MKMECNQEGKVPNYTHYLELPLKLVGCWEWFPNAEKNWHQVFNITFPCFVLFVLLSAPALLFVNLYTEWAGIMSTLDKLADSLPYIASFLIVTYFAFYQRQLYELNTFMNKNFKFHSARGLTNSTMSTSYKSAKNFSYSYIVCAMCSAFMYAVVPMFLHWWTKAPLDSWFFMDVTQSPYIELAFLRQMLAQAFVGLALGGLSALFASNAILLCGQLDLLCCSLRNARFTALLQNGVEHGGLVTSHGDITKDELHNYSYNHTDIIDSEFNYDEKVIHLVGKTTYYDIYSPVYDAATEESLRDCATLCQVVARYKQLFENFVSPLLVVRVVQVTLFLCTLLYSASQKFEMITVEYLLAVALDIFIYCYFGNQIITQAGRVSLAAYQSSWAAMGARPRRTVLNILLAHRRPAAVRAGGFLPMDLTTYVAIIKTSFSYYTLLVNVNEH